MSVIQDRDLLLRVKLMMPKRLYRMATLPVAAVLRALPDGMKYRKGLPARRKRLPYAAIQPGDNVMQIGAPSDLLAVGRSRAAYFLHMVSGGGKVIVMEPDTINCDVLSRFAAKLGLADRLVVIPKGGWKEERILRFFQSRKHPASAVLEDLSPATPTEMAERGYDAIEVPVTTVDNALSEAGLGVPKLISITTNGAELQILEGMAETLKTGPEYIALAVTGDNYVETMPDYGYVLHADDDRGFTFKRKF